MSKKDTSSLMKCDDLSRVQDIGWGITNIAEAVKALRQQLKWLSDEQGCDHIYPVSRGISRWACQRQRFVRG